MVATSNWNNPWNHREIWFPRLIVVPLSSHAVDGVRKEKERLTAAEIFLDIKSISAWRLTFPSTDLEALILEHASKVCGTTMSRHHDQKTF